MCFYSVYYRSVGFLGFSVFTLNVISSVEILFSQISGFVSLWGFFVLK